MRHANIHNDRIRTKLKVEGDLVGLIKPIMRELRHFGEVTHVAEKDARVGTAFFVVTHTSDPLEVLNSVLNLKGVDNVVFD